MWHPPNTDLLSALSNDNHALIEKVSSHEEKYNIQQYNTIQDNNINNENTLTDAETSYQTIFKLENQLELSLKEKMKLSQKVTRHRKFKMQDLRMKWRNSGTLFK